MNIQSSKISQIAGLVVPKNRMVAIDPVESSGGSDAVQVSQRAREVAAGVEALKRTPEVREDKVAEVRARLASPPKAADLVDALLGGGDKR